MNILSILKIRNEIFIFEEKDLMKRYLKAYNEFLPIAILVIYVLGYSYQFGFYRYFGVNIEYYISLTDIIFSAIYNLFLALIYFLFINLIIYFGTESLMVIFRNRKVYKKLKYKNQETIDRYESFIKKDLTMNYMINSLFITFLVFIILGLTFKNYTLFIISVFFPYIIYRAIRMISTAPIEKKKKPYKKIHQNFLFGAFLFSIILLFFAFMYWGYNDANKIKDHYTSIVLKTDTVSTEDGIHKFIGETSLYYFILNSNNNDVIILNKNNLDRIQILENKFEKVEIEKIDKKIKEFLNK